MTQIEKEMQNVFSIMYEEVKKKYSDQLSTTALVMKNATKNLENRCFIWS